MSAAVDGAAVRPLRRDDKAERVHVKGPRVRRVPWIALGVILVLVGALGFGLMLQSAGDRTSVVVASRDINPGQQIERADLRLVDMAVDGEAALLTAAERDGLVGQVATSRIPAGSVVNRDQFAADSGLKSGQVVIGVPLGPGGVPVPDLRVGDRVRLLETAAEGEEAEADDDVEPLGTADVYLVTPGSQPDVTFVSLAVTEDHAQGIADAAAAQRLRLVLVPAGEGPEG
jgi:hypothetical protein